MDPFPADPLIRYFANLDGESFSVSTADILRHGSKEALQEYGMSVSTQHNNTLSSKGWEDEETYLALVEAFGSNVKVPSLDLQFVSAMQDPLAFGNAFKVMLKKNKTLREISVRFPNWSASCGQVETLLELLEALKVSNSVKKLDVDLVPIRLHPEYITKGCCEGVVDLLKTNDVLEKVNFEWRSQIYILAPARPILDDEFGVPNSSQLRSDIDFYLRLNRLGRKNIIGQEATREQWIDVLIKGKDQVDSVFFFLSHNPSLLCNGNQEITPSFSRILGKRPYTSISN